MTQQEADQQIEAIRKVTQDLIAQGPEACRQFLIDAGIVEGVKSLPVLESHDTFLIGINSGRVIFFKSYQYKKQKEQAQEDFKFVTQSNLFLAIGSLMQDHGPWIITIRKNPSDIP